MAFVPVWGTGFEMGNVPTRAGKCVTANSPLIVSTGAKTGTYAVRLGSNFNNAYVRVFVNSLTDLSVGCWAKYSSQSPAKMDIRFNQSNGNSMRLRVDAAAETWNLIQYVAAGSTETVVAVGSVQVTTTDWHNMQVWLNGTALQTRINGNADISYLFSSAIVSIDFYGEGAAGGYGGFFDDISIGSGGWTGDIRYDVLIPDADTAVHSWVPSGMSLQAAPAAPTVGVAAGPGLTGDYHYRITLVDTDGETLGGTISALVQPANQVVTLTAIPTGLEGTTARKVYRTAAGGSVYKLVATINDNTTTSFNDSVADGSLGVDEPGNVHFDKVDERPASDADFIFTATNGAQDLVTLSDWDATKKVPLYVVQWARLWKDTADTQQCKLLLKSGISSTLRTSAAHDLVTAAAYEYEIHTTDPAGAPWTNAEIDALQAGVEAVVP